MKFEDIIKFDDVSFWVEENVIMTPQGTQIVRDVKDMLQALISTPAGMVATFELGQGSLINPVDKSECEAKEFTVIIPNMTPVKFVFALDKNSRIFNLRVDEGGERATSQGSVQPLGFGEIKEILDVASWIASDGLNPDLSMELIDIFEEDAAKFLKNVTTVNAVEMRLGMAQDLMDPTNDKFRVIQLIRQNPYRTIMFVFTMRSGRISSLDRVNEEDFKQLAASEWRYLQ